MRKKRYGLARETGLFALNWYEDDGDKGKTHVQTFDRQWIVVPGPDVRSIEIRERDAVVARCAPLSSFSGKWRILPVVGSPLLFRRAGVLRRGFVIEEVSETESPGLAAEIQKRGACFKIALRQEGGSTPLLVPVLVICAQVIVGADAARVFAARGSYGSGFVPML